MCVCVCVCVCMCVCKCYVYYLTCVEAYGLEIVGKRTHTHTHLYTDRCMCVCYIYIYIYITFVADPPLMMAQSRAESTRDTCNYGQYINKFPQNTIKVIREFRTDPKENM